MLLLAAFIWGSAFVAQSVGMDYVEPFTFNCVRSIIGGLVLIPCIYLLGKLKSPEERTRAEQMDRRTLLAGGVSCGVILCLASNAQQIGIKYTTVGKAGFITALYIVIFTFTIWVYFITTILFIIFISFTVIFRIISSIFTAFLLFFPPQIRLFSLSAISTLFHIRISWRMK